MAGATIPSEVPDVGTPIIDPNGYINVAWHNFFYTLLRRTGGSEGLVPVTSVGATLPLVSTGGTDPLVSINPATPGSAGSLSAADKTKLDSVTAGAAVASVSGNAPITSSGGATPAIGILNATPSANGAMSASDKTKLDGIASGASVVSVTGSAPISSSGGNNPNITISLATPSAAGAMSASDKTKLDTVIAGAAVSSVTGTAPIVSSGGAAPAISITPATTSAAGSLSAADKTKLDNLDYQTGTWTPTLTFVTPGNLAVTYTNRLGFYTKIGRKVAVNFVIGTSAFTWTTSSGNLRITGLPFTANSGVPAFIGQLGWTGIAVTGFMSLELSIAPANPTLMEIIASGDNKPRATLGTANAPSGNSYVLIGHIEYFV